MCGGFVVIHNNLSMFSDEFMLDEHEVHAVPPQVIRPRFNVRPGQEYPVVIRDKKNELREMRWGLVPSWSKTPRSPYSTFNARIETVAEKPVFRAPFKKRRCLVPASGYYEWQKEPDGKQPYYVHRPQKKLMAFAGLFDVWEGEDGAHLETFTIITKPATGIAAEVHDRMPAILSKIDYAFWLDTKNQEREELQALLSANPPALEISKVSRDVNSARNDSSDLITPI